MIIALTIAAVVATCFLLTWLLMTRCTCPAIVGADQAHTNSINARRRDAARYNAARRARIAARANAHRR